MALRNCAGFLRHLPKCHNVQSLLLPSEMMAKSFASYSASRALLSVSKCKTLLSVHNNKQIKDMAVAPVRNLHILERVSQFKPALLTPKEQPGVIEPKRTLIKFGFRGRRKTVKAVVHRFYRLHWGAWIRPRSGRHNKLWRKGINQKKRARTHVFCNSQQSYMLDKMVSKYWWRRKYYVDDPYEHYHTRPDFWITHRR